MVSRPQQAAGVARVVASIDADIEQLLHAVTTRLAGLRLQDVEDLVASGEEEVVEPQDHGRALAEGTLRPGPLTVPELADRPIDVGLVGERKVDEVLTRERGDDRDRLGVRRHRRALQQALDERAIQTHAVTTISTRWNSLTSL